MQEQHLDRVVLAHEPPFQLGAVHFHPSHRLIQNGGRSVVAEPRVMQLLVALARADGDILSRDDIMDCCWNGRIVGDNALHRAVRHARKVLAEVGDGTIEIETIKGVGYRLRTAGGQCDPLLPEGTPAAHEPSSSLSRRGLLITIGAGAMAVAAAGGSVLVSRSPDRPSAFAMNLYRRAEAARNSE